MAQANTVGANALHLDLPLLRSAVRRPAVVGADFGAAFALDDGLRPFIMLQKADHPLWREQREGITLERAAEIASQVMTY